MAKTKRGEREKRTASSQKDEANTPAEIKEPNPFFEPAYSRITPPQSRPLIEEDPQSRPLNEEEPQSRAQEEETSRLSTSSEEAVLDTSISAQGKEITTALTVLGRVPNPPSAQQETEDTAKPVHEGDEDESNIEVDYDAESADEDEQPALRNPLSSTHLALRVEPTTTPVQEPVARHEREVANESPNVAEKAKPVLDAISIREIAERKDIRIKTPVHNHNPQRQGLEDNLFDFGDALVDYTSDGGTIRINQGLATFMLIAATAEAPNRLLMERKREAFDQVTAQAQELLAKQREIMKGSARPLPNNIKSTWKRCESKTSSFKKKS
jgi:hypothetical protein